MTTTPARHVAIYCRISNDKDGQFAAVTRQRAQCEAHLERLQSTGVIQSGLPVVVYVDNDISAFQTKKKRDRFEAMLDACNAGEVEAVVAVQVDRLYRRSADLFRVAAAVDKMPHLLIHTVNAGKVDFSNPAGRLAAGMLALIAQFEVELKEERQRDHSDAYAQVGRPRPGGRRPFGYEKDGMTIREDEAQHVRDVTARLLAGESVSSLIREWNREGVLTVRERDAVETATERRGWTHSSFIALVTRYRNAGLRQHKRSDVPTQAAWPPLVDLDDFTALRAILTDPSRNLSPDKTRKHLLSFILTCSECGTGMRAGATKSRDKRYPIYQCPGTKGCRRAIRYDVAENSVLAYIAHRLTAPDASLLEAHEVERTRLRDLRKKRAVLSEDERIIERSKISTASKARQLETIHAERTQLDAQIEAIARREALASLLAEATTPTNPRTGRVGFDDALVARDAAMARFDALPLDKRREIVKALCEVTVLAALPGVSYKFGRAYERIEIYPKNAMTGEVDPFPILGAALVGRGPSCIND